MLKHRNITYYYQFLAEAIIAFLVIYPFTYAYYDQNHYWGFLFIIFLLGACFFLLEKYDQSIGFYFLVFPIGVLLFYLFDFPLGLLFLFPLIFIWRYMRIRTYKGKLQEEMHLHKLDSQYNREMIYIHLTIVIGIVDVIYSKEIYVMYFVFLQFIILLVGNLLSHVSLLKKEERKKVNLNSFLSIPVFLAIGSVVSYFIFDPFRQVASQVWKGIQSGIIASIGGIIWLLGLVFPNLKKLDATEEQEEIIADSQEQDENEGNPFADIEDKSGIDESTLVIVVTCVIAVVVIFFIVRALRNKQDHIDVEADQSVTHRLLDDRKKRENESLLKRIFGKRTRESKHPVRKLIYQFEKTASEKEFGRYSFESIDEWFLRLQLNVNYIIYEKVRYGDLEVSEQEVAELEQQLKAVDFSEIEDRAKNETEVEQE